VTDRYVTIPIEAQIAALNRAALLIDGDASENVVAFHGSKMVETMETAARFR
jgi:hypothetical protein